MKVIKACYYGQPSEKAARGNLKWMCCLRLCLCLGCPAATCGCLAAWLEVVSAVAVAPHAQANNQMERIKFEKGIKATKWLAIFQNTSTCVRCPISLTQRILEKRLGGGVSPWHYRHSQPWPAGPGFGVFFSALLQ